MASSELERVGGWDAYDDDDQENFQRTKTPISWNWTLLPNKVAQSWKGFLSKGFTASCSLEVGLSSFAPLCCFLLHSSQAHPPHHHHHHHHHHQPHHHQNRWQWLCSLYLVGGILWQSRFLFVIHVLCRSTKSEEPSQAIHFSKKLFNTFG